jgi:hypothetical protein
VDQSIVVAAPPSRNRPNGTVILLVLLVTFPLLALLVLEQSRVIDAQRLLILQLNSDSQQLNAMRMRQSQERRKQAAETANPSADASSPSGAERHAGAAPDSKNRKSHETKQAPPAPPQEYPASRPVPVRKAV